LYANTSENGFLAREMKNIDYLLKIKGETETGDIDEMVKKLKQHELISLAFRVSPDSLKAKTKTILSR
jgi:effector-binding domain-containing protein